MTVHLQLMTLVLIIKQTKAQGLTLNYEILNLLAIIAVRMIKGKGLKNSDFRLLGTQQKPQNQQNTKTKRNLLCLSTS
jgi:hypothetical protein